MQIADRPAPWERLSLADDNFELFSFSAYYSLPFSFNSTPFYVGWSLNALARFKVAFTALSTAVLAKEKCFAQ